MQVWHAIGRDRKPLRKQYIELILPPFIAILRRWRPLLAGIHELTSSDGQNPLIADDRALAADALPIEVLAVSLEAIAKLCITGILMTNKGNFTVLILLIFHT
jgi:hypothetical protein